MLSGLVGMRRGLRARTVRRGETVAFWRVEKRRFCELTPATTGSFEGRGAGVL